MSSVGQALRALLADLDEDHQRLARVVAGLVAPPPLDGDLAALAVEVHRLRWLEPDAPTMALLAEAATDHADAVERHLAWVESSSASVLVLPDVSAAPDRLIRLAS